MAHLIWEQDSPFGISFDDTLETWNAGHVNDILAIGYSTIVASDTGGVWLINPAFDAIPQTNIYPAICVSDDWLDVNMNCLAFGPDAQTEVFAACWDAATLYALTFQLKTGEVDFVKSVSIPVPWWAGGIYKILVQQTPRRIILACGAGILWSKMPNPFDQPGGYQWRLASGLPYGAFSGMAFGPGTSIAAAAYGADMNSGLYGFFVGDWNQTRTDLIFTRASTSGLDLSAMRRTSLASCAGNRKLVYAVSAAADNSIAAVAKSQDGGSSWSAASIPNSAGNQGWYNNCIDVNPTDSSMVVIGWRGGPFVSIDGAGSWGAATGGGLHSDLHVVYFPGLQNEPNAFFVGSDGGVALVSNAGTKVQPVYQVNSKYNMHLRNLQIYGGDANLSGQFAGLYSGGTQDNGNLYCVVDPSAPPIDQPWYQSDAGDGGINRFVSTGQLLRYNNTLTINNVEYGNRVRVDTWNAQAERFPGGIGTVIPVDGTTDGLPYPILEIVDSPTYMRNKQLMYAIGGKTDDQSIYGLFADSGGANMHWTRIAQADGQEELTCLASSDGNQVIVGTKKNQIYACDSATGTLTEMPLSLVVDNLSGYVTQLLMQSNTQMLALHSAGYVLMYTGTTWDILPGLPVQSYAGLALDPTASPKTIYVATGTSVFASTNNGVSWANESQGLPVRPQIADLRFVQQSNGNNYLYLGTYGRSLWRARVPGDLGSVHIPPHIEQVVRILVGVINDGGGWTTGGPEPPWGVDQDLLAGVLAASLAQTIPGGLGAARANEALGFVAQRAQELLGGQATRGAGLFGFSWLFRLFGRGRSSSPSLQSMLDIISRSGREANSVQELTIGLLAASLARQQGGRRGQAWRTSALRFVEQQAQQTATDVRAH